MQEESPSLQKKHIPQSPWTGTIGALVGLALSIVLAWKWGEPGWWGSHYNRFNLMWMIPILIFILMALLELLVFGRIRERSTRPLYHQHWLTLFYSSFYRYITLGIFYSALGLFYSSHPFYKTDLFTPFRYILPKMISFYWMVGWPYIFLTLGWKGSLAADLNDLSVQLLLWGRHFVAWIFAMKRRPWKHLNTSFRSHTVWRGILVECFFLPIMCAFFNNQFHELTNYMNHLFYPMKNHMDFNQALQGTLNHSLYLMDVLLTIVGYALPLRWLDNKIRSAEPTLFGWLIALVCYPPLQSFTNQYIAWPSQQSAFLIVQHPQFITTILYLSLVPTAIYVWATMAFGMRFSNLTNRGILDRGPYAWVRHPAYAAKNLAWWMENLPWMGSIGNLLSMLSWNGIYMLRAWTEERHLRNDPAYKTYCKNVPWRFIPKLF